MENSIYIEFNKIFNEQVKPFLEKKEFARRAEFSLIILLLCSIICGFIYLNFAKSAIVFFSWLAVSVGFIFYVKIRNKKFSTQLKEECLPKLLTVFERMIWRNTSELKTSVINKKLLQDSGLFAFLDKQKTDDEFRGTYNGIAYIIAEIKLYMKTKREPRFNITIFKGILSSFKLNKKIKNRTIVSTKGDLTAHSSKYILDAIILILTVGWWFINPIDWHSIMMDVVAVWYLILRFKNKEKEPMNKVTLEDPLFNKRFNVYSSDQVEARYLLTTAFMERFYNLKTAFGARGLKCSFFDDNLMIAIHTRKNLFEIGDLFHSLTNPKISERLYNEIYSILSMIEYFKLDENTGL